MTTNSELMSGIDFKMNMDTNDLVINFSDDITTIQYYKNLEQAIINRLRTAQGELELHPAYGSQLKKLIGEVGNSLLLSQAYQYTKEALLQEPRINKINSIKTSFKKNTNKNTIIIQINVTPIGQDAVPLNIVYDYFLG